MRAFTAALLAFFLAAPAMAQLKKEPVEMIPGTGDFRFNGLATPARLSATVDGSRHEAAVRYQLDFEASRPGSGLGANYFGQGFHISTYAYTRNANAIANGADGPEVMAQLRGLAQELAAVERQGLYEFVRIGQPFRVEEGDRAFLCFDVTLRQPGAASEHQGLGCVTALHGRYLKYRFTGNAGTADTKPVGLAFAKTLLAAARPEPPR